jgi:hypothetical protein
LRVISISITGSARSSLAGDSSQTHKMISNRRWVSLMSASEVTNAPMRVGSTVPGSTGPAALTRAERPSTSASRHAMNRRDHRRAAFAPAPIMVDYFTRFSCPARTPVRVVAGLSVVANSGLLVSGLGLGNCSVSLMADSLTVLRHVGCDMLAR